MTSDRARAYGRAMTLLDQLGPAKLHADEQRAVRDAADAVLFTRDIAADAEAAGALGRLDDVLERLVESGRLEADTAVAIMAAVEQCGPHTEVLELPAAA